MSMHGREEHRRAGGETPLLSLVTPVYCEGARLQQAVATMHAVLEGVGETFEIVVVDDGSTDDSWEVIRGLAAAYPGLRAVRLSRNFGKEAALCAGLEMARGRAVVLIDADLQHPPELVGQMVQAWRGGAEVVEAIKHSRGQETLVSRFRAHLFYSILNRLTGYNFTDVSDFKLLDRRVVDAWLQMRERNVFFRGMIAWLGYRRVQIPFDVSDRLGGESKWTFWGLVRLAATSVTSFSSTPLQFVTIAGGVFFVIGFLLGLQTLARKLTGTAVSGFTTVILLQLIIGSMIMMSLGIIGNYVAAVYEEVKRRPRYVVSERIEPTRGS